MPLIGVDLTPGNTDSVDIPIWVPDPNRPLTPLAAAFISQANSMLIQLQRILRRLRSQVLYEDKFEPSKDWTVVDQKLRIVGEVWAYFELTLQRKNTRFPVPPTGNFTPIILGSLNSEAVTPQSLAFLGSTKTGRLVHGHALSSGEVKLDAINSGRDIRVGDVLTLAGAWPLDNWLDSEV